MSLRREAKLFCSLRVRDKKPFGHSKFNLIQRRLCRCKFQEFKTRSLSMPIDIERSMFIGLIDSLHRFLSPPAVSLAETRLVLTPRKYLFMTSQLLVSGHHHQAVSSFDRYRSGGRGQHVRFG